jgi:hypothetical protein
VGRKPPANSQSASARESSNRFDGHIFISHSSKDTTHVQDLKAWLELLGLKCWISFEDISNVDMRREIEEGVDSSAVFLLVWSANSLESREVLIEIDHAHRQSKPIISFQLDESEPPKGVNYILRSYQYIPSAGSEKQRFIKLATLVFAAYGYTGRTAADKTKTAWKAREEATRIKEERHQSDLDRWEEEFWRLRWDSSKDRARVLTQQDTDQLRKLEADLGIDPGKTRERRLAYKRNRRVFFSALKVRLELTSISNEDLLELEMLRKRCCISKSETQSLVSRGIDKIWPDVDKQLLSPKVLWWTECFSERTKASSKISNENLGTQTTTRASKTGTRTRTNDAGDIHSTNCEPIAETKSRLSPKDTHPFEIPIAPNCSPRQISNQEFNGIEKCLSIDNALLLSAARLLSKAGMENKVLTMANQSLKEARSSEAYLLIGCAKYLLGLMMDAITNIQTAIGLERKIEGGGSRPIFYNMLGIVRLSICDFKGAFQEFTVATEREGDNPAYIFNRGLAQLFLGDRGAINDLTSFCNNIHAYPSLHSIANINIAARILSGRLLSSELRDEINLLMPLLHAGCISMADKSRSSSSPSRPRKSDAESHDSSEEDTERGKQDSHKITPFDLRPLLWDWQRNKHGLDSTSYHEVYTSQIRCEELLKKQNHLSGAAEYSISCFDSTNLFGFIRSAPSLEHVSSARRAISRHSLDGKMTGRLLLHFNESRLRHNHGILLFERGISLCTALAPSFWYPHNILTCNSEISFSIESGSHSLVVAISQVSNVSSYGDPPSLFRFSHSIVKGNSALAKALTTACDLLRERESAWMNIRQLIRNELSCLHLSRQSGITCYPEGADLSLLDRLRIKLGYFSSTALIMDSIVCVSLANDLTSTIAITRSGLTYLSAESVTHFAWAKLVSFEFLRQSTGGLFRINGQKNVPWCRPASSHGLTAMAMHMALDEFSGFVMSLKSRLCISD